MSKKPVQKRPPKTLKEKRFVKEYLESGSAVQAALKVYDTTSYNSARQIAVENLHKLTLSDYFREAGLTEEVMAQAVTVKALTAKKRDHFSGEYEEDHRVQLDALKFASELMGLKQVEGSTTIVQPILTLEAD